MASRSSTEPSARRSPTSASPSSVTTSCGVPCTILHADGGHLLQLLDGQVDAVEDDQGDVVGELAEEQSLVAGHRGGAQDGDPLVADLPAVAVGAVQHVPAPPLGEPGHVGQLVD